MLPGTSNTGTVVGEVTWSSVLKTTMDCHSELVLHSLGNNQLIFPGPYDQTCCSILNMLQLVRDFLQQGRYKIKQKL